MIMEMKNSVILIPSYEPDSMLVNVVKGLIKEDFPVLVVDDGSGQEYEKVFDEVKPYVTFISYSVNKGKGHALKEGFAKVRSFFPEAKYVITVDGDGQHSVKDILKVHEELNKRDELVFGVRKFDKNTPFRSKFGNYWSRFNRSLLTKEYIGDDQCGLRGYPLRYLNELTSISGERYEYEMNQIVIFNIKKYQIYEVEVETIFLDNNSRSHFSPFRDTVRIQWRILSHSFIALLVIALMIFFTTFIIDRGLNIASAVSISYFGGLFINLAAYLLVYPSKNYLSRILTEVIFSLIKMSITMGLLYLFSGYLLAPYQLIASLSIILVSFINIPLSFLYHKIKNHK